MAGSLGAAVRSEAGGWSRTTTLFGLSLFLGATFAVLPLLLIGQGLGPGLREVLLAMMAGVCIMTLLQPFGVRPVQRRWQVPERWRRQLASDALAVAYGIVLGPGFLNSVMVSAFWVFLFATLLVPPIAAMAGWAIYETVRTVGFHVMSRRGAGMKFSNAARSQLILIPAAALSAVTTVLLASHPA